MTVLVSHLRDWLYPERITRRREFWQSGMTPRSLAPDWAEQGDPLVGCAVNGGRVADWDQELRDRDHVHYWVTPGWVIPVGSALLAAAGNAVLFSIYGYLLQRLLLPIRKPPDPSDQSSQTYAFTNLQRNLRGDGVPIPVIYGQVRFAPPVVNEFIRSSIDANGNPVSEYLALYLLGEGPIYRIGDKLADGGPFSVEAGNALDTLEIKNQPAKNFSGVEAHVRLGSTEQTAIAEFADPVLEFTVDKTLRASTTLTAATSSSDTPSATTAIATPGAFISTNPNVAKWDAQQAYVSGDDCDEFAAILEFPSGLVAYDSAGVQQSTFIVLQGRYRQVDGSGVPFGSYVVLAPEQPTLTRAGILRIESRHKTYDPATYAPPTFGFFAQSRAAAQGNPGLGMTLAAGYVPAGPSSLQFSFSTWIRRRNVQAVGVTNRIFQWFGTNAGFRVNLTRDTTLSSSLQFQFGTGAAIQSPAQSGTLWQPLSVDVTNFHQLVVTYEGNFDGHNNARTRFYLDGALKFTDTRTASAVLDASQIARVMTDSATSPTLGFDGHMDETSFWSKALTPYEIASFYNGGLPQAVDSAATGLLFGGRMDTLTGNATPNIGLFAFGPFAGTLGWILGSGTNAGTDPNLSITLGIVRTPEGGTLLRGKFQVEYMRLSADSTSQRIVNEVAFKSIQLRTFMQYTYPGMALLAVKVPSNDQLSGGAPLTTTRADGRLVPIWDGGSPIYPNMPSGYSRNAAWVCADALLNRDFGLGALYRNADLDVAQFKALADSCDEQIYDNQDRAPIMGANYRDSATEAVTFDGTNLGTLYASDVVRYRVSELPLNFPQPTSVATGKFMRPNLTGILPSAPAWLTAQIALVPQEILYVEFRAADNSFYIYTRTTQTLAAGQTAFVVSSGADDSNGLEMFDVRARFDGVFDRADFGAWDAIVQILQTARAAPIRIGSRLSIFIDDAAQPVALVTMGNIVEGSWKQGSLGVADRPNAESSDFLDELLNWERTPISDEHPDVNNPALQSSFRWKRVSLEGITRRGQAKRFLRRDLNVYKLNRRWCEFKLGIDSIPLLPGELLDVSHDVPQIGFSGRMFADGTNTTVKLDRAVTIGTSWQIEVQDTVTGNRYTVNVTQAPGAYAPGVALTVAAFSGGFIPAADDQYAIGVIPVKTWRLVDTRFDPRTMQRTCRCIEYDPAVFSDDFGTVPLGTSSSLPVPTAPTVPSGVENLSVSEQTARGPDGHVRIGAAVSFTHDPETFSSVGGSDVYLGVGGHETGFGAAQHKAQLAASCTSIVLEHQFARYQKYTVWIVPRTKDGISAYRSFASWAEFTPGGLAEPPLPPRNLRATMHGDLVTYLWDDDEDSAQDQARVVEFRRGGGELGTPMFTAAAGARHHGPFADWATGPANAQGVTYAPVYARTKLGTGQCSEWVRLDFAPAVVETDGDVLTRSEEDHNWA